MRIKVNAWHILLVVAVLFSFFPFIWMLSTAFKEPSQIFSEFLNPIPHPLTLKNYLYAMNSVPLLRYLFNSLFVATVVTIIQLFTSLLAAYAFTQFEFKGRSLLFYLIIASMFVPFQATMLPNYLLISKFGWLNTYAGLIAPQLASGMGVFLLRQTFRSIPKSLLESARVEGAGDWQRLWKIIFPSVRPTVIALGILLFINVWNEYFWPLLVINNKGMLTLPLALQLFINAEGGTSWGPMMAVATLTSLPPFIAFLLVQKQVISSFINSGVKG